MVKILSVDQIQKCDLYTIKNEPILALNLMERAARAFCDLFIAEVEKEKNIIVVCGTGNNGGDGLAIARILFEEGFKVKVFVVESDSNRSVDCESNLNRLPIPYTGLGPNYETALEVKPNTVLIDAIFGTGLNRAVEGWIAALIAHINKLACEKVSVDIPSGLLAEDNHENTSESIIQASKTISFQFPKLAFLFPENEKFVGLWRIVDIGLHPNSIKQEHTPYNYVTMDLVKKLLKPRALFSHKGTFGKAMLLAGSKGKIGAAVLASKACLRSGIGLLSIQLPKIGNVIVQTQVPEAMLELDMEEDFLSEFKPNILNKTIGIGPGIGKNEETKNLLKKLIQEVKSPMILDADALNILAENKAWISFIPKGSILTPHPKEFRRLVGTWQSDFERLQLQQNFSKKNQLYLVLKGNHSAISTPEGCVYFNSTGNSGMATGGSGDVLTGILTALLAQQYSPLETALLGVYVHGLAGDIAAKNWGEISMLPTDLINSLPEAFQKIDS